MRNWMTKLLKFLQEQLTTPLTLSLSLVRLSRFEVFEIAYWQKE